MNISEDIANALKVLQAGGTLLYPTDTVWGIGCDATDPLAVEKVYKLKRRFESKSMLILLDRFERLSSYVKIIPDITFDLLESIDSPVTVIYSNARNLASNVIAPDGTVGIRIIREPFCQELISRFGKPIVSTSANISGEPTPAMFSQIPEEIRNGVDYVVRYMQDVYTQARPSTIIRLHEDGNYKMIRY